METENEEYTFTIGNPSLKCSCEEWGAFEQIVAAQAHYYAMTGILYTGPPAHFCPWCGRELQEEGVEPA